MKDFDLKSGTSISITDTKVIIDRSGGKSAIKGLLAGRTMGLMTIKLSSITGLIFYSDYLVICASGLPSPNDFKITSVGEIKQYPNCIVGKQEELQEVYNYLVELI